MEPLRLSILAGAQAQWLGARQKVIAENVAHADTPGYRAMDLKPFSETLNSSEAVMRVTHSGHLSDKHVPGANAAKQEIRTWDIQHSGNTVSVDQQMLKAGEVYRAYATNTNILKAFSRMLASSLRSGG
jgi:flagellar basal-body rod protein FlgB